MIQIKEGFLFLNLCQRKEIALNLLQLHLKHTPIMNACWALITTADELMRKLVLSTS